MKKYYIVTRPPKGANGREFAAHIETGFTNARKSSLYFQKRGICNWIIPENKIKTKKHITRTWLNQNRIRPGKNQKYPKKRY